ncbi:hypothetical protein LINGRAHAP2_LOCUS32070 [Linum grandiflorum]
MFSGLYWWKPIYLLLLLLLPFDAMRRLGNSVISQMFNLFQN